jgi:hypothetical protein
MAGTARVSVFQIERVEAFGERIVDWPADRGLRRLCPDRQEAVPCSSPRATSGILPAVDRFRFIPLRQRRRLPPDFNRDKDIPNFPRPGSIIGV